MTQLCVAALTDAEYEPELQPACDGPAEVTVIQLEDLRYVCLASGPIAEVVGGLLLCSTDGFSQNILGERGPTNDAYESLE